MRQRLDNAGDITPLGRRENSSGVTDSPAEILVE